jgi:hypothetical protein
MRSHLKSWRTSRMRNHINPDDGSFEYISLENDDFDPDSITKEPATFMDNIVTLLSMCAVVILSFTVILVTTQFILCLCNYAVTVFKKKKTILPTTHVHVE